VAYEFKNISVLIAEDNIPMQELLKNLLSTFGVENIYRAKDGKEAFQLFLRHNPDLVIADWMMDPVDGIELSKLIRNDPKSINQFIPIVLMTGFSEKRRVMQARDAGVTEFLVKPFNARDLYRRIAQVIEHPRQFVRSEDFFGPDRRRKSNADYTGPLKREDDAKNTTRVEVG
jgi:two-component system chemotaxis response regulator CheY